MNDWELSYNNNLGTVFDFFEEWWDVFSVSKNKSFRCDQKKDAEWLLETLNSITVDEEL